MKRKILKITLFALAGFFAFTLVLSTFIFFYAGLYEFFPSNKKFDVSSDIQDKTIEVNGLTVHYRTLGDSKLPDMVFIHGWGGAYDSNDHVTTALNKQGFQVFTFEVPGLDRSDTLSTSWSNDDYARFYATAFNQIGIEKPVIVGQSFGGGIVASYANLYPQGVKHLVLVDANTTDKDNFYPRTVRWLGDFFRSVLRATWIPSGIKDFFIGLMLSVPNSHLSSETHKNRAIMADTFINTHSENQLDKLRSITVPTLMVWGESDTKVPMKQVKEMQEALKNEKLRTLPGGHTVLYKDPDGVAKIIGEEVE